MLIRENPPGIFHLDIDIARREQFLALTLVWQHQYPKNFERLQQRFLRFFQQFREHLVTGSMDILAGTRLFSGL